MTQPLPIGIVLPGAQRWHRANVIHYVLELGMTPILLIQPEEEVAADIPISAMILPCPASPTEKDLLAIASGINKYCRQWYVLPLDDYISETAARLSQHASAPCYPPTTATAAFRKHILREHWNQYCQSHPEMPLMPVNFALYYQGNTVHSSMGYEGISGPFIIKPNAYSGSVGVLLGNHKAEVATCVAQCAAILNNETANPEMRGIAIDQHVLVEEAIPRKNNLAGCAEFTTHYLSFTGQHHLLGVAEKTIHPTTFIETGHLFPSPSFPAEMLATLHTCAAGLLDELNVQNTISNWEFIITPDNRLAMVEGQLRPSGDHVMDLIENAYQVSPYTLLLQALQTGKLEMVDTSAPLTSMIYWPSPSIVLEKISAVHVPEYLPAGVQLHIDESALKNTPNWQGPVSWYGRHVSIISTAADATIALQQCEEVLGEYWLEGVNDDKENIRVGLGII